MGKNNKQDIRWKQRFQNLENTLNHLEQALELNDPDIIQRAGLIQFFEMSYDLSWKIMKDYLEELGYTDVNSPREAIKKSFETGIINDGHSWLKLMADRNLTSHAYDEESVKEIEIMIREKYYKLLKDLYISFKQKYDN